MEKKLLVSLRAGDPARTDAGGFHACLFGCGNNTIDSLLMQSGVANDSAFADLALFQLELRLYQDQEIGSCDCRGNNRRKDFAHGDE